MTFELEEDKTKYLFRMVALGNYFTERYCEDENEIETYKWVARQLMMEPFKDVISPALIDAQAEFSLESYFEEVRELIDKYEEEILPINLARKLAEYHYPVEDCERDVEDYTKNCIAEDIYLEVLEKQGIAVVHIDIPDFEDRVEKEFAEYAAIQKKLATMQTEAETIYFTAIAKRIKELLEANHLTAEELGEKSGVDSAVVTGILSGEVKELNAQILNSFCKVFKISLWQFYQKESFEEIYETPFFKEAKIHN